MKRNFFEEDRELFDGNAPTRTERIINDLTPEFAPEARFDFRTAERRRRIFGLRQIMRLAAAAAVLAIGIFIGINGGGDNARAAENHAIIEQALADLNASESYRIEFTALVKDKRKPNSTEIYDFSPDGQRVGATIMVSRNDGGITARIEWADTKHSTQIFENGTYRLLENGAVAEEFRCDTHLKMLELLDFESVKVLIDEMGSAKVRYTSDKDTIEMTIRDSGKGASKPRYPDTVITTVFSRSNDKLLNARVRCVVDGAEKTLLDVTEIEYGM